MGTRREPNLYDTIVMANLVRACMLCAIYAVNVSACMCMCVLCVLVFVCVCGSNHRLALRGAPWLGVVVSLTGQTFCRVERTSANCCQQFVAHARMLA